MEHEAHHDAHHSLENKPKTALNSSFWFVLILALLFISAVNFVKIESNSEEGEGEGAKTEHVEEATTHEAGAATETPEKAEGAATADSTAKEGTDSTAHTEEAHH